MLALPVPEHGGNLLALRELVNIADDGDWALVLAWLVAALRPTGPYPILLVHRRAGHRQINAGPDLPQVAWIPTEQISGPSRATRATWR